MMRMTHVFFGDHDATQSKCAHHLLCTLAACECKKTTKVTIYEAVVITIILLFPLFLTLTSVETDSCFFPSVNVTVLLSYSKILSPVLNFIASSKRYRYLSTEFVSTIERPSCFVGYLYVWLAHPSNWLTLK